MKRLGFFILKILKLSMIFCLKYGWNWPRDSGEEKFEESPMYFYNVAIKDVHGHFKHPSPKEFRAKFVKIAWSVQHTQQFKLLNKNPKFYK